MKCSVTGHASRHGTPFLLCPNPTLSKNLRRPRSPQQGPFYGLGAAVPRSPRRGQQRPTSDLVAPEPTWPHPLRALPHPCGPGARERRPTQHPRQCLPHSPATGDWRLGLQKPLAGPLRSPGHCAAESWGQAGPGCSQRRDLGVGAGRRVRTARRGRPRPGGGEGWSGRRGPRGQ